jgi:hypothetical protein
VCSRCSARHSLPLVPARGHPATLASRGPRSGDPALGPGFPFRGNERSLLRCARHPASVLDACGLARPARRC